MGVFHNIRAD
jgi:hypothetical protein